jgi:hypothetical protein
MAYALSAHAVRDFVITHTPTRTGKGLLVRLLDAMVASRQHQADREIARFLAGSGGKFTDETEREIERRFLSTPSGW